jgi:aldehyde dehydrogenase
MANAQPVTQPSQASGRLFRSEYGLFINGEWLSGATGKTIEQFNPATGEVLGRIQAGSAPDVIHAADAAAQAFPKWSRTTSRERQQILLEMARRLRARSGDYALMESLNNGKTVAEASFWDVPKSAEVFEYFAGGGYSLNGETHDYPDSINIIHREAIGVVAQIIPWNVPLLMMAGKLAPAIAAGCTVVLKPAETVCLSVMEFMREIADILPKGVVNVVTGYGTDVGEALVTHPAVRKVAFTGSVPTARRVIQYAAQNIVPQTLELGGKSAQIVCPSADIDAAVEGAAMSTVFNKGEVCLAGSRVFVHESIKEEFVEKLKRAIESIRIGDPTHAHTQLGAQASKIQFDKICEYLELAPNEGARVLTGGAPAKVKGLEKGYFIQPTILDNVTNSMRVAREEIFGPVTCLLSWKDEGEVVRQANDSAYGLAGGVWTKDIAQAHRIARELQTGTVWVNRYYNNEVGQPLGGYKQSGYGREFTLDILRDYTVTKSVVVNLADGKIGLFG